MRALAPPHHRVITFSLSIKKRREVYLKKNTTIRRGNIHQMTEVACGVWRAWRSHVTHHQGQRLGGTPDTHRPFILNFGDLRTNLHDPLAARQLTLPRRLPHHHHLHFVLDQAIAPTSHLLVLLILRVHLTRPDGPRMFVHNLQGQELKADALPFARLVGPFDHAHAFHVATQYCHMLFSFCFADSSTPSGSGAAFSLSTPMCCYLNAEAQLDALRKLVFHMH